MQVYWVVLLYCVNLQMVKKSPTKQLIQVTIQEKYQTPGTFFIEFFDYLFQMSLLSFLLSFCSSSFNSGRSCLSQSSSLSFPRSLFSLLNFLYCRQYFHPFEKNFLSKVMFQPGRKIHYRDDCRLTRDLTAKNTVILTDFLVWKFCRKAQFPHGFGRFEITVFFAVFMILKHSKSFLSA